MNEQIVMILGVLGAVVWAAVRLAEAWIAARSEEKTKTSTEKREREMMAARELIRERQREFVRLLVRAAESIASILIPPPQVTPPATPRNILGLPIRVVSAGEIGVFRITTPKSFKAERMVIYSARPDAFNIVSMKIGDREMLKEGEALPGELFASATVDENLPGLPFTRIDEQIEFSVENKAAYAQEFRACLFGRQLG